MELEDRITIATAEGIELNLALAGAGSRFIASVADFALQLVLIGLAALATLGVLGGGVGEALFAMCFFGAFYVYDIGFEVLGRGQTPGKRMMNLRVVRMHGEPVDLPASAVRNLVRLVDALPGAYLVGAITIFVTARNQRLGDLAAGTVVVRERTPPSASVTVSAVAYETSGWDVTAVTMEELTAVRHFLARRGGLDSRARWELAYRLEQGLREKVAGAPPGEDPEEFLEALAQAKASR